MDALWWGWGLSGALLLGGVLAAGRTTGAGWLGALLDARGRYSLSRFQFLTWMLVVLPLAAGVFVGTLIDAIKVKVRDSRVDNRPIGAATVVDVRMTSSGSASKTAWQAGYGGCRGEATSKTVCSAPRREAGCQ